MKFLFKWVFRLIFALLVLAVALLLGKDAILRSVAERQIRAETGLGVRLGKFEVGLLTPIIVIEDFKLYNTAEFGGGTFIHIPEIYVEYDRSALRSGRLHVNLMRFNLSEFNVVRNETGKTNVVELAGRLDSRKDKAKKSRKRRDVAFDGIDTLNLTLGTARFMDWKAPAHNREIRLGIQNHILKDVKSEKDLYGVLPLVILNNLQLGNASELARDLFTDPAGTLPQGSENLLDRLAPQKKAE